MIPATFCLAFSGFWAGFEVLFWEFLRFQLLFSAFFRLFELGLAGFGVLFLEFMRFQLLFLLFSGFFGWVWGAVLGISAFSATFSCSFPVFWLDFWVLFGEFMRFQLLFPALFRIFGWIFGCCLGNLCGFSSTRPACYAINLWLLYIMIIEKSSIF